MNSFAPPPRPSDQPKLSVLFVDDEPQILDGHRRQFRTRRGEWDMRFASSGAEALIAMEQSPADVIVSDMRMPNMSGGELLLEIQRRWPATTRIVLSGQTDAADLQKGLGAIHQYLAKPCDPDELCRAVKLVGDTGTQLRSPRLRSLVQGLTSLPVTAKAHEELTKVLGSPSVDADTIAEVVQRDVGLSVKILQLVNSAFFGLPRQVASVKEGVVMLGAEAIRVLAFSDRAFEALGKGDSCEKSVGLLWAHSLAIGAAARQFAKTAQAPKVVSDAALLAGMLSLIGRASLLRYRPAELLIAQRRSQEEGLTLEDAEAQECGAVQQAVGGFALRLWGFGNATIEAVTYQADPRASGITDRNHPLPYVHMARCSVSQMPLAPSLQLIPEYLESMGLAMPQQTQQGKAA